MKIVPNSHDSKEKQYPRFFYLYIYILFSNIFIYLGVRLSLNTILPVIGALRYPAKLQNLWVRAVSWHCNCLFVLSKDNWCHKLLHSPINFAGYLTAPISVSSILTSIISKLFILLWRSFCPKKNTATELNPTTVAISVYKKIFLKNIFEEHF